LLNFGGGGHKNAAVPQLKANIKCYQESLVECYKELRKIKNFRGKMLDTLGGFVVLYKEINISSYTAVNKVKHLLKVKKQGI
jgi:tRNA U55 pseudouridine synthase TruB